ncbi:MAG: 2-hydroxychromene-2-carboxylate isomerase [Burkholderiales bacterium]
MPAVTVQFVFGLGSRYSYLASTQLDGVAARTGCVFEWVPVSSVELMAARGQTPFRGKPPSGQYEWEYRRRDAEDWARFYGVPFVEPHPPPEDHALLAVAIRAAGEQGVLVPFARAMFDAIFVEHRRIDESACVAIAASMNLDVGGYRASLSDPALRQRVSEDARRAADHGAFGVPTFLVGGRSFWGNDRLVLLEHWLAHCK